MSTSPTPTNVQLGTTLAQTLTYIANAQNQAAIANYTTALALYQAAYGTSPNSSAPPPPTPPMLSVVNAAAVVALEVEAGALIAAGQSPDGLNWNAVYTQVPYAAPAPVGSAGTGPSAASVLGPGHWVETPFGQEWVTGS